MFNNSAMPAQISPTPNRKMWDASFSLQSLRFYTKHTTIKALTLRSSPKDKLPTVWSHQFEYLSFAALYHQGHPRTISLISSPQERLASGLLMSLGTLMSITPNPCAIAQSMYVLETSVSLQVSVLSLVKDQTLTIQVLCKSSLLVLGSAWPSISGGSWKMINNGASEL